MPVHKPIDVRVYIQHQIKKSSEKLSKIVPTLLKG